MNTDNLFKKGGIVKPILVFFVSFVVFATAVVIAHLVQTDFGSIEVTNVYFKNFNGKHIRAKLFRPLLPDIAEKLPGIVFIHGYQNNRESGDAYNIEMAKRGFVVLGIDAIGRGNSDVPNDLEDPDFDDTFGTRSSVFHLRSLPFVKKDNIGVMGHSMGAKFAYHVALEDPAIQAVVIIGSAYDEHATIDKPKNMLMIIGELDEFRDFFTGTKNIVTEWMISKATQGAFPVTNPDFDRTYGDFSLGTARRVFMPRISHIQESHNSACIAEALEWMRKALKPPDNLWQDSLNQTWVIKETMTLLAMLACFICTLPLALLLLKSDYFSVIRRQEVSQYAASDSDYLKGAAINGGLMWLYLPLIMTLFAVHKFVIRVDTVFPMLLVDAIVWWFVWINLFGLILLRRWYKRQSQPSQLTLFDLGLSYGREKFRLGFERIYKIILLGVVLFAFLYFFETLSEKLFLVDFRFIYPLVSDLTPYRIGMFFLYFPFLLFGFFMLTLFVHGQIRRPLKGTWLKTYFSWTGFNILALISPLILFLLVQYIPLLTTGFIPFEGPGGVFVVFILELFFIMLTLTIVMLLSTWFFQITRTIYLSAIMNALIVTWLFASSQVVAPIP